MRAEVGTLYPRVKCPHLLQVNSAYVHRDKIGGIVSSILLMGFQKLQINRLFSIHLIIMRVEVGGGGHFNRGQTNPIYCR